MRVLFVEDEIGISQPLCKMLEKSNVPTDAVYDGLSGYIQAQKDIYDVIILDIMLPEMNGFEILKKLRANKIKTPVLLLTAKDSIDDKAAGFGYGADDYLTKPFSTQELIMRVKALARRNPNIVVSNVLVVGDISLDTDSALLTVGKEQIVLPAKEAHILEILIQNKDHVLSKDYLLDKVWGLDSEAVDNTVEIYMHYLRKKLSASKSVRIITQRGLGYVLKEDGYAQ